VRLDSREVPESDRGRLARSSTSLGGAESFVPVSLLLIWLLLFVVGWGGSAGGREISETTEVFRSASVFVPRYLI
jgi:hypothetical protein